MKLSVKWIDRLMVIWLWHVSVKYSLHKNGFMLTRLVLLMSSCSASLMLGIRWITNWLRLQYKWNQSYSKYKHVLGNILRSRYNTPQYGWNGMASLQIMSCMQQAHRFYRWQGEPSPACIVHVACVGLADYHWALPRISSVAIATQPMHRLQIRPIVHN